MESAATALSSFAVIDTVPASFLPKVNKASVAVSRVSAFCKVKEDDKVNPGKVFAPAKVCVPVVTSPRAVAEASGKLNVCVVPEEAILKSVPVVDVANVCVAPVKVFKVVMPEPVASAAHSQTLVVVFHLSICDEEHPPNNRNPSAATSIPETEDVAVVVALAKVISTPKVTAAFSEPEPATVIPEVDVAVAI